MKRAAFWTAGILCIAAIASGQDRPMMVPANTVYVGADGKFEANPDTALIQFNIAAQQSTARGAYDRASKAAEQVREILRSNGIEPKAAEIGYYSIEPVQEYRNNQEKLVGYRVSASVSLKLKDFSKIAPIVQQLADGDITDNNTVSYTLDDMDAAKTKAVQDAYRRVRQSAEAIATAGGRALGELSSASVDIAENARVLPMGQPLARMSAMASTPAPTQEFSPQTISVTAHVNATFTMK
jgi:uncharacterized protein YggE